MPYPGDPYGLAPIEPDPFAVPPPVEEIPQAWRDIVASAPEPDRAPVQPDPLGFPASSWTNVDAALAATPPAPKQPDPYTGIVEREPFVWPEQFGGPPAVTPEAAAAHTNLAAQQPPDAAPEDSGLRGMAALPQYRQYDNLPDVLAVQDPEAQRLALENYTGNVGEQRAAADLASIDPVRYAALRAGDEFARKEEENARKIEAATASSRQAENNARAYRESLEIANRETESLQRDAKALATQKIDDDGWFKSRSVPATISAFVAAIVGGLNAKNTGGRNLGLENILKMADDWVTTQKFNMQQAWTGLQRRQGMAEDKARQAGDLYKAGETLRLAAYERVVQQLQGEMGKYNPKGTKALAIADTIRGVRAAQAKALDAHNKEMRDAAEKAIKIDQAQQQIDETARAAKAREANDRAQLGLAGARLAFDKDKQKQDATLKAAEIQDKRDERDAAKADKAAEQKAKQDLELGVGGAMVARKVTKEVPDPVTGKPTVKEVTEYQTGPLLNKKGDVWHAPDAPTAQKLRAQGGGAQVLIEALDDVRQLRASVGGANKFTSPGDVAAYKSAINKAVIAYGKANDLSLSDEQSVNLVRDRLFGGDPSDYRVGDVENRIEKAIGDVKSGYYDTLKRTNFDGDLPKFDRRPEPAKLSAQEELSKKVQQAKTPLEQSADAEPGTGRRIGERVFNPIGTQPWERKRAAAEAKGDPNLPGLDVPEADAVRALLKTASDPVSAERDAARQQLVNLASAPGRPELQSPVLKLLEDTAPDLWEAAVRRLPEDDQAQWRNYKAIRDRAKAAAPQVGP